MPFYNTTLRTKLIVIFLLLVLVPTTLIALFSERLIRQKLGEEVRHAMEQNVQGMWTQYYIRANQMKFGMLQVTGEVETAILKRDKVLLRAKLNSWKKNRPYVDTWTIVDLEGKVLARLNSEESGDLLDLNGLVDKALSTARPVISTEVVPRETLLKEGEGFANEIIIPVISSPSNREYRPKSASITDALMLTVVVPVKDKNGIVGAIIAGDILNKDNFVPDAVAAEAPGTFSSIVKDGVRIATNLQTAVGSRAIGTLLSADIMAELQKGKRYSGIATLLGERYIAAHAPIKDNKGAVIGNIFVGVPESQFLALQRSNRLAILVIAGLSLLFALAAAIFISLRITRPLKLLAQKTRKVSAGDMDIVIPVEAPPYAKDTKDEVAILSRSFSSMVGEIKERNKDRERHLLEMEKKTEELSSLNERLQASNQELEVALEEAQSQQEELQSANEELTILNEELEKKTNELLDANRQITTEEAELKRMRDHLQLIFNGIKDYVFLLDPSCTILDVNTAFLEAYNLQKREVIGKKCYQLVYGLDQFDPECDVSKGSDIKVPHRFHAVTKDNRVLERHVFPVLDGNGRLVNKIEYIRDVTVETTLKEQLIQAEKLSSLGEILSGVAHELNNPLTGVIGYCELLHETTQDKELKEQFDKINEAALRCKKIIENMLSFARQNKVTKKFSDMNEVIRQTVELKTYPLKVDNIEVIMDLDKHLPYTMLDAHMLLQVFLNIINNAHNAMVDKGGRGRLAITSRHEDGRIKISFTDTGVGIPAANLKKIFDPFFTTREIGKGTGLGLSISYGIIKEHGGEIYAESSPGEGATFHIDLPVGHPEGDMEDREETALQEKGAKVSKKKVLIIDDEPMLLDLLKAVIEEAGHEVDATSDARYALEKIRHAAYDLIICDMRMPHMDGKEFYREVEELSPGLQKKIIFSTGDVVNADTQSFLKQSGARWLEKPFTPTDLKRFLTGYFNA
ncbi:MAG: cache domain-containing protein [Nitrospirae bacterium]|nr:cache domain-containing protein [Nitrospirota bacterium]